MIVSQMLPGTLVVYYGDEIGFDSERITCEETVDPWALPPYAEECDTYPRTSRDPGRTPMQVEMKSKAI